MMLFCGVHRLRSCLVLGQFREDNVLRTGLLFRRLRRTGFSASFFTMVFLCNFTAVTYEIFPVCGACLSGKIAALIFLVLEHLHNIFRYFHTEAGTACRTQNGKRLSSCGGCNLILFAFVNSARLLIQCAQILHIVGRQRKDKAVLAGIDDGGGLPRYFLAAYKVLDILGDDNLHTIVFTDTFRKLEHEIQCNRELRVDEYMGFINGNYYFAVCMVFRVVIPVFDNFVINVLQH